MNVDFSIVLLTYKRDDILDKQFTNLVKVIEYYHGNVEVILVDNNADFIDRAKYISPLNTVCKHQIIQPSQNLGVSGGRNVGFENARGDYVLFIDDDAILQNIAILAILEKEFLDEKVGIVAGKSFNPIENKFPIEELPHSKKSQSLEKKWKTFRFIGVVHCIRSEVIRDFRYDESFFYGMEEMDLSFYSIQLGWEIIFVPDLYVHHFKHPSGRIHGNEYWFRVFTNKIKVVRKYYPFYYGIPVTLLWFAFILFKSKRPFKLISILAKVFLRSSEPKMILNSKAISYIKSVNGSLLR